jgi:hypothetical protein
MIPWSRDGLELVARFTRVEATVLADLVEQSLQIIEDSVSGDPDAPRDPALARLLPTAYPEDEASAEVFRRSTEGALVARKVANARVVIDTLHAGTVRLAPTEVQAWLRALTDLRLIIATRLGIEHDDDPGHGDEFLAEVYPWLGYLQGSMLEAMEA